MTTFDEVAAALTSLEPERAALFAASSATRLRPVVNAFGSEPAREAYDAAVERLWRAERGAANVEIERLEAAPEADEDDSHLSSYEVMRTLSLPAMALELLDPEAGAESAEHVAGAAADIAAGLDVYLGQSDELEGAELADQLSTARRVAAPDVDLDALRTEAEAAAGRIAAVLPDIASRNGWLLRADGTDE